MRRQSIPNDQQSPGDVPQQMRQELDHLLFADSLFEDLKIEVPPCHAGHDRDLLPVEVILQHRRLTAWCPGPAAVRSLTQSAFVDENNCAALFLGFFLMSGQSFFCQRAMAAS